MIKFIHTLRPGGKLLSSFAANDITPFYLQRQPEVNIKFPRGYLQRLHAYFEKWTDKHYQHIKDQPGSLYRYSLWPDQSTKQKTDMQPETNEFRGFWVEVICPLLHALKVHANDPHNKDLAAGLFLRAAVVQWSSMLQATDLPVKAKSVLAQELYAAVAANRQPTPTGQHTSLRERCIRVIEKARSQSV